MKYINYRDNKNNIQKLGTKQRTQNRDLGPRDTVLGMGTKIGTLSQLQVKNKM